MIANMKNCPEHGSYPARFDSCPICGPATQQPRRPPTIEQALAAMDDGQIKWIFNDPIWTQGDEHARQAALAEFDKRFDLENWPERIPQDGSEPAPLPMWE